jgi:tetratricopeptide (TPR) repeat protein
MPQSARTTVFISYSHNDKKWLDRLRVHLKPLERDGVFNPWDDTRISAGAKWLEEIEIALASAKVAILLVSADFLASDFITQTELPRLLQAAEREGARVISAIIGRCRFQETPSLSQFQAVNDPSRPLTAMTEDEQEDVFYRLTKAVEQALATAQARPLEKRPALPERNPLFTGRQHILTQIEHALRTHGRAALTGLSGVGKTQTAIQYAYSHEPEYNNVFWVSAASRKSLMSDYDSIASVVTAPDLNAIDDAQAFDTAMPPRTERTAWLLILDNADDLDTVRPFVPNRRGHVLLTTCAKAVGTLAKRIELTEMQADEAVKLLLRRANIENPSEADLAAAHEIATTLLDGLPLALDQAGAYIEETGCGLPDYIDLYRRHAPDLLKYRGSSAADHPHPVASTWALSFEKIEKANPAAADLLRLCAFVSPEPIPEELLATELPDPLCLNSAMSEILKYSLLARDANAKTVEVHRLVQQALKHGMNRKDERHWAERAVRAVDRAFPSVKNQDCPSCERLLPQALACAELITQHNLELEEAARLLNNAGSHLRQRARYADAERLFQRSLAINQKVHGSNDAKVALVLNNLATIYDRLGQYDKAEPLYQRALWIDQNTQGPDHPDTAVDLNNLAEIYRSRGEYDKAEPLYRRSLLSDERTRGPDHPDVARDLNNLALLHYNRSEYDKAEPLYVRSLKIREKALGSDHPDVANSLNNLATLYYSRGEYAKAALLYRRALEILQKLNGPDHPDVTACIENLAHVVDALNESEEAVLLFARVSATRAKSGPALSSLAPPS